MKIPRWLTVVVVLGLLLGSVASIGAAPGQQPERVKVLIGFTRQPGPPEEALVRGVGGTIKHTYHLIPTIAATVPETAILGLLANPHVTHVNPDGRVWALDPELDNSWGVKRIGAGVVHPYNKGTGVKVAIIDTGIDYNHFDLDANYAGGWDFVNGDNDPTDPTHDGPMDDHGHGTHVAGTVAAEDNDIDTSVVGVAPEAALYALKVLDESAGGYWSDVIAAIQWSVDPNGDGDTSDRMDVINMSLGGGGTWDLEVACQAAYDAGLLLVAAAGNDGNPPGKGDNIIEPASYASVIAVAATEKDDARARFSSTGPDLELSAPGVDVNSTWLGGGYHEGSGTSMASPHVAGTAALVWIAYPSWTNADVRTQLQNTADDLGPAGKDDKYGYGLVDADEAAPDTTPPEPTHDVAVTSIDVPSTVGQGDMVFVDVTVANEGTYDETFTLTLTDETDVVTIGSETASLAAGGSITITFDWNTDTASLGDHTLTASHDFADNDASNDSKSTTVTVKETAATMHVGDLDGSKDLKGKSGRWEVFVTVTIHDENETLVANATVSGTWSGDTTGSALGTTGSDGTVTFSTGNMSGGSSVTFSVDNVTHGTLTYDATANHDPDGDSDGTSITVSK